MAISICVHCGERVTTSTVYPLSDFIQTGTTLLMALPLGAVLCFFNLLGARAFSRGELLIQYHFHKPLSYPPPYPPRPIFTRYREPTLSEIESGRASPRSLIRESSFYKNTYAMVRHFPYHPSILILKTSICIVHRFDLLSSALLFPCNQACYYTPFDYRYMGICFASDVAHSASSGRSSCCEEIGNLAGKCCYRGALFGRALRVFKRSLLFSVFIFSLIARLRSQ